MDIRKATVADAEAIALVHVRSWQEAYRGQIDQAHLDSLDSTARQRVDRWAEGLATDDWPAKGTLVAVQDASVVGFVSYSPARDDDLDPTTVADLMAIYILASHWRGGGGRLLMDAALDGCTAAGYHEVALWVLDGNVRAERFYAATGWHPDGSRQRRTIGGHEHDVLRLRHPLADRRNADPALPSTPEKPVSSKA